MFNLHNFTPSKTDSATFLRNSLFCCEERKANRANSLSNQSTEKGERSGLDVDCLRIIDSEYSLSVDFNQETRLREGSYEILPGVHRCALNFNLLSIAEVEMRHFHKK